jgi:hypothetical protein
MSSAKVGPLLGGRGPAVVVGVEPPIASQISAVLSDSWKLGAPRPWWRSSGRHVGAAVAGAVVVGAVVVAERAPRRSPRAACRHREERETLGRWGASRR